MCFDGALGYVQIASDFRIVTTLKEQVDQLLLSPPQLNSILFHALHLMDAHGSPQVAVTANRSDALSWTRVFVSLSESIRAANPPPPIFTKV